MKEQFEFELLKNNEPNHNKHKFPLILHLNFVP